MIVLFLACTGDAEVEDSKGPGDTDPTAVSSDFCGVQQIFASDCTSCHSAALASGGLDLETDPYPALVGVESDAYPGQVLVVAGDAASSFLYLKMTDQQSGDGDVMPPSGALEASLTDVVRQWIDDGASADCDTTPTGTGNYHPEGWEDPAEHGIGAKFQEDDCLGCHGDDLGGGSVGVSCNDCHEAGWETDCTFCHGGTDNPTGAPPEDIDDSTTGISFGAHSVHVVDRDIHVAFDCVQCHQEPTEALSPGHFLVSDGTPGVSEVELGDGISDAGSYAGGTCSNLWCHGNGRGDNGEIEVGDEVNGCNACHSENGLAGEHEEHLEEGLGCEECHQDTAQNDSEINDPAKHINGQVDLNFESGMEYDGGSCDGECHGENHRGRDWD